MPATVPDPEERSPLSPRDEAIFLEIVEHLRATDPALVARLSRPANDHFHLPAPLPVVGGLIALLALVMIVTEAPSAVWPLVGLLIAIHLLPVVLMGVIERHNRR
jgi:hypothetical protein